MHKIVPLPEGWNEDWSSLLFTDEELRAMLNLRAVIHTASVISDALPYRLQRRKNHPEILEGLSIFFFTHCSHLAESVYNLCLKGYGPSSILLSRALIEATIDFAYLWLCKKINDGSDEERFAWFDFNHVERYRMHDMLNQLDLYIMESGADEINNSAIPTIDEGALREKAMKVKEHYGRNHWSINRTLEARARKVDQTGAFRDVSSISLEMLYATAYRWTSQIVHGSSGSWTVYIEEQMNKEVFTNRPSGFIASAASITSYALLNVLYMTDHIMHTQIRLNEQLSASGMDIS